MKKIVQKFTKPGDLVMYACAGTLSATKACMNLLKHRKFIGCAVDPSCVTEMMTQLILPNAQELLSKESHIDGEGKVCSPAEVYVKTVEAIEVQK